MIPPECATLGWQESLHQLAHLTEPEIRTAEAGELNCHLLVRHRPGDGGAARRIHQDGRRRAR